MRLPIASPGSCCSGDSSCLVMLGVSKLGYAPSSYKMMMQQLEQRFGGPRCQVIAYLEEIDTFKALCGEWERVQELDRLADIFEVTASNIKAVGRYAGRKVNTKKSAVAREDACQVQPLNQ